MKLNIIYCKCNIDAKRKLQWCKHVKNVVMLSVPLTSKQELTNTQHLQGAAVSQVTSAVMILHVIVPWDILCQHVLLNELFNFVHASFNQAFEVQVWILQCIVQFIYQSISTKLWEIVVKNEKTWLEEDQITDTV